MNNKIHFKTSYIYISLWSFCVSQSMDANGKTAVKRGPPDGSLTLTRLRTMGILCMEYSPCSFTYKGTHSLICSPLVLFYFII